MPVGALTAAAPAKPITILPPPTVKGNRLRINPAYVNAPYEICFLFSAAQLENMERKIVPVIVDRQRPDDALQRFKEEGGWIKAQDNFPIRLNTRDTNTLQCINPFEIF